VATLYFCKSLTRTRGYVSETYPVKPYLYASIGSEPIYTRVLAGHVTFCCLCLGCGSRSGFWRFTVILMKLLMSENFSRVRDFPGGGVKREEGDARIWIFRT